MQNRPIGVITLQHHNTILFSSYFCLRTKAKDLGVVLVGFFVLHNSIEPHKILFLKFLNFFNLIYLFYPNKTSAKIGY